MKYSDAFYAAIGAPVLAGRKLMEVGGKTVVAVREGVKASAAEGRDVADKFGDANVVEELTSRLEVDERVGKLRDQVEGVVDKWREGFQADAKTASTKTAGKSTTKPAAKKAPAKKAAAKPTAKKSTPKKAAAKPAAKKTTKKATTKSSAAQKVKVSS